MHACSSTGWRTVDSICLQGGRGFQFSAGCFFKGPKVLCFLQAEVFCPILCPEDNSGEEKATQQNEAHTNNKVVDKEVVLG